MGRLNHKMVQSLHTGVFSIQHTFGRNWLLLKTSLMQKIALPGFYLHFALRKRCIADHVTTALKEGTEQLIVI